MAIVTRTNKGSKLTIQEMDGNFTYLDQNKSDINHTHSNLYNYDLITLISTDWVNKTQTLSITGITTTSEITVSPTPDDYINSSKNQIIATEQGNGTITFSCVTVPTVDIKINVKYI